MVNEEHIKIGVNVHDISISSVHRLTEGTGIVVNLGNARRYTNVTLFFKSADDFGSFISELALEHSKLDHAEKMTA